MSNATFINLDARLDGALLAEQKDVPAKLQVVRIAADTAFEAGELNTAQLFELQKRIANIASIRLPQPNKDQTS